MVKLCFQVCIFVTIFDHNVTMWTYIVTSDVILNFYLKTWTTLLNLVGITDKIILKG